MVVDSWQEDLANLLDSIVNPQQEAEEDWSQFFDPPLVDGSDWEAGASE